MQSGKDSTSTIPIYHIHSFEQPFCRNPLCLCQLHKQAAVRIFTQLIEGKLDLQKAAGLLEKRV